MQIPAYVQKSQSLLVQVLRLARQITWTFESQAGMSHARIRILGCLLRQGEMNQTDLQAHVETDSAAITRQLAHLEQAALISRRLDPRDNRFALVTLTELGKGVSQKRLKWRDEFEKQLLAEFSSEELSTVQRFMQKVSSQLDTRKISHVFSKGTKR